MSNGSTDGPGSHIEIEQLLREMNDEWVKALVRNDGETLDRIWRRGDEVDDGDRPLAVSRLQAIGEGALTCDDDLEHERRMHVIVVRSASTSSLFRLVVNVSRSSG